MSNIQSISELPEISFIDNLSVDDLMKKLVSDYEEKYEEITGESIELPLDNEYRMILGAIALQIYQMYQYIEKTGRCNSLKYAYGEFLDHIGALKNVKRHSMAKSKVQIKLTLSDVRNADVEVPEGTRVSTGNYDYFWEIQEAQIIPAGELEAVFEFECTEAGAASNGFDIGEISELMDPLPYVDHVSNTTRSEGGSDEESDESFANRILIAPSAYSVAGTEDAYIYHVKSFSNRITEVKVVANSSAQVYIYILLDGGEVPNSTMIDSLQDYIDESDNIKPLTDQVIIAAPEQVNYSIEMTYYIDQSRSNQEQSIKAAVQRAVDDYIKIQASTIGKDINNSLLIQMVMNAGAKRVEVVSPTFSNVSATQVASNEPTKTVTYGGLE